MITRQLALREYATERAVHLSLEQRNRLVGYPVQISPSAEGPDRFDVTASSHVGTIELPGLSVRIHPKLSIERVLFLISYATGRVRISDFPSGFGAAPDLVEAIVAGFVAQVRRAVRPGLLQSYRLEEDALPTVRGRIRFEMMASKRLGVIPPIDVRYDEYTVDIDENRVLKAALIRLSRLRLRSADSLPALRSIAHAFAPVSDVEFGAQLPDFTFNRLNDRYAPALALAKLILCSVSYDLAAGSTISSSFLVDMNQVFEDFVVHALRDALRLDGRQFPQGAAGRRLTLDMKSKIRLEPDISWWEGHTCVFVGDIKYKKTRDARVPNADLYQLLAYATATDLPGGLLIYAAGEDEPGIHIIRHANKQIEVAALDLAGSPKDVLAGVAQVADRIEQFRPPANRVVQSA